MSITTNDQEVTRDCATCKWNTLRCAKMNLKNIDLCWNSDPILPDTKLARVRAEVVRMRDNVEIPARDDDRPSAWGLRTYRAAFCTVLDLIDREAQK